MNNKIIIIILLAMVLIFPLFTGPYFINIMTTIFVFLALSLSWDIMLRTGQLSFGTAAFFGLGAYASAVTILKLGWNPLFSIFIGGLVVGLISYILGYAVLKLREIYFSITTLAITSVFSVIIRNMSDLTGGAGGATFKSAIFDGDPIKIYYLLLFLTLTVICISEWFKRSKIHFAINSIRNDEITAKSSGIDVFKYLLLVFVITSVIQGVIGAVYAQQYAFVEPESTFSLNFLLLPIAMALVGGIYSTIGPIIGAFILGIISEYLKLVIPYGHLIVYGLIIVIVVLYMPSGIYKSIQNSLLKSNIRGKSNDNT